MHYQDPEIQGRIEHLFNHMAVASRITTAQTVAHDYKSENINKDDFYLAELLLKFLINDVETDVRAAIAEQVKDFDGLPRDLALQLAMDVETVSIPILKTSNVLQDEDLVEILNCASDAKQVIIADRTGLPAIVTETIAEKGCYDSVKTCLGNLKAEISEHGYDFIIIRYANDNIIHELLVRRPNLPEKIVTRLSQIVSEEVKKQLFETREVPEEIATRMVENAREHALVLQFSRQVNTAEKQNAVVQLEADGRLTATLMLRSIILGDFYFFTACLAHTTGISMKRVTSLVCDHGFMGLKRLYNKACLPHYLYPAFKAALEQLQEIEKPVPRTNSEKERQTIIDKIAIIYNYEEGLAIETLMEKLLPRSI